jgi:hypothetical protein
MLWNSILVKLNRSSVFNSGSMRRSCTRLACARTQQQPFSKCAVLAPLDAGLNASTPIRQTLSQRAAQSTLTEPDPFVMVLHRPVGADPLQSNTFSWRAVDFDDR